jgi:hypothetical protein
MVTRGTVNKDYKVLFNAVKNRYGSRITVEELEEVRKAVERIAEASELLRSVELKNGDEPFFILKPYKGKD